jgi:Pretoxin HINT domain
VALTIARALGCVGSSATRVGRLVATGMRLAKLGLASKAIYDSAQALQAAIDNGDSVGAARAAISLAGAVYAMLAGGCFAAGTPILTPDGSKLIEDIRPGDWVITAPDDDPDAQPVPRRVEESFENYLPLLDLYVNGRTIRTTAEHPFWVRDRGWVAAQQLEAGDELRALDGRWLKVDGLEGPKASETVYNMCVAEYHTYFIGDQIWGFAVWSHNMGACNGSGDGAPNRRRIGKFLDGDDVAEASGHAKEVGRVTGVVDRAGATARRAERMRARPTVPGMDRDEFPPATIKPDDPLKFSVKPINPSQNRRSGRRLRDELPPDGTPVEIDP